MSVVPEKVSNYPVLWALGQGGPCKPHAEVTSGFLNNTPGRTCPCVNDVPRGGSENHFSSVSRVA